MDIHETYIHRCIDLAKLGAGNVAPNPMVGAVLVHDGRIIGEGYHEKFGLAHAEVNCINSVSIEDAHLISSSTLYVSLEPCAHHGKTPPCTDLIIEKKIPAVIIGCRDPFEKVDGKGIEKLQQASIAVTVGVLENECIELNKRFFTFHTHKRPYVILKWAQTADEKIAASPKPSSKERALNQGERLFITNEFTNRLVHKWRSEEMGILVGTKTALLDNPELTNRLSSGNSPIRLVIDMDLKLPSSLKIFNKQQRTIVFNAQKEEESGNVLFYKVIKNSLIIQQILNGCYQLNMQSILVEGGAQLLQSFIDIGLWDEARIITNCKLKIGDGLSAPKLFNHQLQSNENILGDNIAHYYHDNLSFK